MRALLGQTGTADTRSQAIFAYLEPKEPIWWLQISLNFC